MRERIRSLLDEPPVPDPPARVWRDWVLVIGLLIGTAVEATLRQDLEWKAASVAVAAVTVPSLLWRRTRPLAAVGFVFAVLIVTNIAAVFTEPRDSGLYVGAFVLILIYSLFRWGSGRHAAIGLGLMMVLLATSFVSDLTTLGDMIGGTIVLLFPAEFGAIIRYQGRLRMNEIDKIKVDEREQLARELHDTVAHHVSAIAIQAQAGRTLAASDPGAALDALETIEREASRTLAEMRGMVGALRRGAEPDLAPQRGVHDIERLAGSAAGGPAVHVELSGDLEELGPSLDVALYRLAQESITNALRHARNPTRVDVRVVGDAENVRLTVTDNGEDSGSNGHAAGYGLVGMSERTTLLGGTLEAGPGPKGGWMVEAVLPRQGRFA